MARILSKQDIISNAYYNLESGFGSIQDTLKQAKEKDPTINRVNVANWLKQQPNKQIRRYTGSNSYTAPFARFEYQIDIMDMIPLTKDPESKIPLKKKTEPRYGLVVIVIDIFSKLANVVPMENKDGESVLTALKESFKKMGFPMSVYSDDDGAFKMVVGQFFQGRRHQPHHHTDTRQRGREIYQDYEEYDTRQGQVQQGQLDNLVATGTCEIQQFQALINEDDTEGSTRRQKPYGCQS